MYIDPNDILKNYNDTYLETDSCFKILKVMDATKDVEMCKYLYTLTKFFDEHYLNEYVDCLIEYLKMYPHPVFKGEEFEKAKMYIYAVKQSKYNVILEDIIKIFEDRFNNFTLKFW